MIMISGVLLGMASMATLSMAMERHHEQIWGKAVLAATRVWVLRAIGWGLMLLAAVLAVRLQGATIGLTYWLMEISLAAVCIGLLLSYAPRVVPWLAAAALLAAYLVG